MINTSRAFCIWNARLVPKAWGGDGHLMSKGFTLPVGRAEGGLGSKCQSSHTARNLTSTVEIRRGPLFYC